PLKGEEIREVEYLVNKWIRENRKVIIQNLAYETAIKTGAMAIFGEKYGDIVRVVEVEGVSKEFCGGTHQTETGRIGLFKILSEESVASGVRRIEGVAGESAFLWVQDVYGKLNNISVMLKTPIKDLEEKIQKMVKREKDLEKDLEIYKNKLASIQAKESLEVKTNKEGVKIIASEMAVSDVNQMRNILDTIKDKEKGAIIFLTANIEGKTSNLLYVPDSLTDKYDASALLKDILLPFGGRGGGKRALAQGAVPDAKNIPAIIKKFYEVFGI
ncbi:MAG: DHHA1 domain-containing protein, partial [Proteobacteria bacterium]|nr:DHHA1 domain-containing protein [Pseudomonadota bacterium]